MCLPHIGRVDVRLAERSGAANEILVEHIAPSPVCAGGADVLWGVALDVDLDREYASASTRPREYERHASGPQRHILFDHEASGCVGCGGGRRGQRASSTRIGQPPPAAPVADRTLGDVEGADAMKQNVIGRLPCRAW